MIELGSYSIDYESICKSMMKDPNERTFYMRLKLKKFLERELENENPAFAQDLDVMDSSFWQLWQINKEYPEEIQIRICELPQSEMTAAVGGIENYNILFQKVFTSAMCGCILDKARKGYKNMKALRSFLEYYDIDEDSFSLGSAYRAWMRFRKNEDERRKEDIKKELLEI
jgi:hypothetical protein